jgi:hypothetical protein
MLYSLNTDSIFEKNTRNKVNWLWILVARSCEHGNKPVEFHKKWRISWQADQVSGSQDGFCSEELDVGSFMYYRHIVTCMRVTVDGVWIGNWIY